MRRNNRRLRRRCASCRRPEAAAADSWTDGGATSHTAGATGTRHYTAPAPLAAATTGHRGPAAIAIVLVAASRAHRRLDPKIAPWVGSHPQFVPCGDRIF